MYYTLFDCIMHFCTFLQIRKCNFLRAPVGVLSSLSLGAIYFIYYFICIIVVLFSYCISNDNKYL